MANNITEVFAPGGPLAKAAGDAYEVRDGQVKMAAAIADKFASGGVLLVEAPTGTGKSVAYLVPAILAADGRKKTVVVTANIALQEQLVKKDLPMLQRALPEKPFTFALAKGIGNYLCLDQWQDAVAKSIMIGGDDQIWDELTKWQLETTAGDLSELPMELPPRVRMSIVTTTDDCLGKKCHHYGPCYAMESRRQQARADIVVTNYHLFFADLAIKAASGGGGILPEYDYVILDEAHQASDIARDFFGWRMTYGGVKWAVRYLPQDKQDQILLEANRFFGSVMWGREYKRKRPRISEPGEVDGTGLRELMLEANKTLTQKAELEITSEMKQKLQQAAAKCDQWATQLKCVTEVYQGMDCNRVYFGELPSKDGGHCAVGMSPIEVADILRELLFEKAKLENTAKVKAVIATSATLTTAGSFDFVERQLGACDIAGMQVDELEVESPFDHRDAAVMIVPTGLPDPKDTLFGEVVAEKVEEVVRAAQGRTLALFTSYKVLDAAYRHLMSLKLPYTILKQGDRPRTQLIDQFRKDVHSVLFGTDSFWEGIDVQGEALSAVVIDRLPFDHPDDPIFEAICERDRKWFFNYSLPKSVIAFRQGFGRLIRSRTDRGAIVVCDRRIVDKPYGAKYIRSLPAGVKMTRSIDSIREVLCPF